MELFQIRPVGKADKARVAGILKEWWAGPVIVTRGKVHRTDELDGFVAVYEGDLAGLVTYAIGGKECEITSMNSLTEGKGIGTALVNAVKQKAGASGCKRLWLITTNDNTAALRFWQRRGFRLAAIYPNAIEKSRKLKPEIPQIGDDGIPIRDEIELEMEI
ncbi:MAG: GNAT family N-acetyltransferase [Dehalococcoidales bacterium]|jgi:ribosomal protein S18 acetylase RimI-like enzyme